MAISAYTSFSPGDVNLTALMNATNSIFTGYNALTLTHMNDTTVPAIAAGSKIEVNGALFISATETAITGSPSDGVVYIYIDPSGPSAVFTNTAPTWSDSKQGWYGTGGTANCRYVGNFWKSGTSYTNKLYTGHSNYTDVKTARYTAAAITSAGQSYTITHGIPSLMTGGRIVNVFAAIPSPTGATIWTMNDPNAGGVDWTDTTITFYVYSTPSAGTIYFSVQYI
jgi:hypothetical protein